MPLYKYEAKNLQGKILKGKLNVDNIDGLRRILKDKDFFLTKYEEEGNTLNIDLALLRKISKKELSFFCREMYFSLSSGIQVVKSLDIVKDQMDNKKLQSIIKKVLEDVKKGNMLSESFKKHKDLPELFIFMIKVGEETGKLDEIMGELADYYDKQYKQEKKIKNALIYPKFLLVFSLIVVGFLVSYIVPIFVSNLLSADQVLPLPTKIVIEVSTFIKENIFYILIFILLLIVFKNTILKKSEKYKYFRDKFIVNSKLLGKISKEIMTARFARSFSVLYGGGISVVRCIEVSSNIVENEFVKSKLLLSKELIKKGASIGESLEGQEVFPSMLIQSIKIGEESGSVDEILKKASEFYDSEANFALEKLASLVEPIMIIILAFLVGFIVLSLVLPMFSMYEAVQ